MKRFLTGKAGTGKSTRVREMVAAGLGRVILSATTGIAALNLGTRTLHSLLGFYDLESLQNGLRSGRVAAKIKKLGLEGKTLVVDEISMLGGEVVELLFPELERRGVEILAVGDFGQLPPVKAKWAFEATGWGGVEVEKLEKVWRQEKVEFLEALNLVRTGRGSGAAELLGPQVEWGRRVDEGIEGLTLFATNQMVREFNERKLEELVGEKVKLPPKMVWGKALPEWREIPDEVEVKRGARVMVLRNGKGAVNGDMGVVVRDLVLMVELDRGGVVPFSRVTDYNETTKRPELGDLPPGVEEVDELWDEERGSWVLGRVTWTPVRLAWASTVHKTQGLTLDRLQVNLGEWFMGQPNMLYVALSRVRSPEGLRLVGTRKMLAAKCRMDPRTWEYL